MIRYSNKVAKMIIIISPERDIGAISGSILRPIKGYLWSRMKLIMKVS